MAHLNKILFATVIAAFFFYGHLHAQAQKEGLKWYTSINEAYNVSKKNKKPVFALFTGSDWCIWCHKLENDVFSKPSFVAWARKNVILLELDFPRNKKLPDTLANQNNSLQQFFHVQGFPTVWIFNIKRDSAQQFNISALGSLGYPRAEPGKEDVAFIETANDVLKKK